ncbi:MAG: TatD family deoxyribonuclease [Chitinophagaceae bacterium]|nr:MAG: TatD family deoxyribonuclease [Chitinophagaceae bacterium]
MQLIDTHAHLYSSQFNGDRAAMLQRALEAGLSKVLLPAIDSTTHEAMLKLEEENPGFCLAMMGMHPCSVKEDYEKELAIIEGHLARRSFIGVGEIGLDFYWDLTFKEQQFKAFHHQVELALQYKLPIAIHSRNANDECIQVVDSHQKGDLKGVFHCFSGTVEQARQMIDLGFYLGIGGVLTFKNGGLDKVLAEIDISHLVLETDAPYLAPVPFRGKRNESSYLTYVAQKLADLKQTSVEEIVEQTSRNAQNLFGL